MPRYFSSNPQAGVAPRYGTGTTTQTNVWIGARRDHEDPRRIVFTDDVVEISDAELARYRREYTKAVRSEALIEKSRGEYEAWLREQTEATERESAKARAEADMAVEPPDAAASEPDAGPDSDAEPAPKTTGSKQRRGKK